MSVSRNMELRHLSISHTSQLAQILDRNDSWKSLMEKIPRNLDDIQNDANNLKKIPRKYSAENIEQIDTFSKNSSPNKSPTTILLDEWGTSGKKRATVSDLLELLINVQLYRAADFVAKDILRELPPKRPENGPAARIDVALPFETVDAQAIEEILKNADYPYTSQLAAQIDSLINNNNRDLSNAISVDRVKAINIFNSSSELISDQFESDASECDTDLIQFSRNDGTVAGVSTTNNNNSGGSNGNVAASVDNQQPTQAEQSITTSTSSSSSSSSSSSLSSSSLSSILHTNCSDLPVNLLLAYSKSDEQSNVNHMLITASNEIQTSVSSSTSSSVASAASYTCSDDNQLNQSTLIPDIDNLQIRDQTTSSDGHMSSLPSLPLSAHSPMTTNTDEATVKNLSEYIPNLSLLNGTSS